METDTATPEPAPAPRPKRKARKILRALGIGVVALAVLAVVLALAINTGPGRGFLVRQIGNLEPESGLKVRIGRIDGSLYSRFTVHDLRLYDLDGQFLAIPEVTVDWKPAPLLKKHVVLNSVHVPSLTLSSLPRLNETPKEPDQPLFPDIDITLGALKAETIIIGPAVAGRQYVATATASGQLAQGRLNLRADASADAGDRIRLRLLAEPDRDRLDINARIDAPATGLVAGLAGLDRPLALRVDGAGQWSQWDGTLSGRLGGEELLTFNIQGQDGAFTFDGRAVPSLLLPEGPAARLVSPAVDIHLTARFAQPRIITRVSLSAPAFTVRAGGAIDTETSRLSMVRVNARLLEPGTVMEGVSGKDIALDAILNGPMARPTVTYDLTAARLGFEGRAATQLKAEGSVVMAAGGRITAPVTLSAAAVEGLPEAAGGLLRRLRLNGIIEIAPEKIGVDKLAFRSDQISGRATFAYAPRSGGYSADVDAEVKQYAVAGFGVVAATVDARIASDPRTGALQLSGDATARALRLDNDAAKEFLGGLPVLTVSARQRADGAIVLRTARLQAPRFQFETQRAVYTPDGRIDVAASGQSAAYGPFTLAAEGAASRPKATLALRRPNLGLRLHHVTLAATPEPAGYFVALDGRSPQGPLRGRIHVVLEEGPLAAQIDELRFADLTLKGRVQQTEAGPVAGTLALNGAGLSGQVRLAAEGDVQRADATLQALRARPPILPALTIGQGSLEASLRLPEGAPDVTARFTGRQIRYGEVRIDETSGTANYQGGTGKANITLAGRYNTPFDMTLSAEMAPERAQVSFNGTLAKRRIRLEAPAVAERTATGWRLNPATLRLAGGRLTVQGETGETTTLQAQLAGLNLGFLDAIDPELGFSGAMSGTLTMALPPAGQTPRADARLVVSRLQRAGLATQSPPIDLGINASLDDRQAAVRALVRYEKAVVGAMQARLDLAPSAQGQDWTARLRTAPMAGGLRFNGPVELLWALSAMKDHELSGTLSVAADLGGTPTRPSIRGSVTTADMTYENVAFGTRLRNIKLDARFDGSRVRLASLAGATPGGGGFSASGYADLDPARGFPMNVEIKLDHLRAAQTDAMEAVVSGPIVIRRGANGGMIEGKVRINEARYRFTGVAAAEVPQLTVQRVGEAETLPRARRQAQAEEEAQPSAPAFNLNIDVDADNRIFIQGMGLDSEWGVDLNVGGTASTPVITGTVESVRGSYSFAGRRFDLSRGIIRFDGDYPPVPTLDIEAAATVEGIEAQLQVTGQALQPSISFSSTPALPQDEILSRLLFGGSVTELSATEALQLGAAVASLRGGGGGLNPLGKMRQATNIDRLRIVGGDAATGRSTSLAVGQYLTDDVYVEVASDAHGNTLTQLQIELTKALSILSQVGRAGSSSLQLQYAKDY